MPSIYLTRAVGCALLTLIAIDGSANPQSLKRSELEAPFTADHLVSLVLAANPGLASVAARAMAAAYRINTAGSLDDPIVSYSTAPRTANGDRGLNQKLDFSQKVPWPGTLAARKSVARNEALVADRDVDARRLLVIAQAKSAFAEWQFVHAALAIHHANQALLDELIATAATRYATGRGRKQDVLQAELERTTLDTQLLRLRSLRMTQQARINALLNRAADASLAEAVSNPVVSDLPPLPVLQRLALVQHPALLRLDAQVSASKGRITLAQKAFYPDFQIGAGYNSLWDNADKRPTVGVSIVLPLNRSKRRAELNRAEAERRGVQWSLEERRAELSSDLAHAYAKALEAQSSVTLYQAQLMPLAAEYLAAALADYASGNGAFLNVITAEQRSLSTELALARARADTLRGRADLERWIGGPLAVGALTSRGDRP